MAHQQSFETIAGCRTRIMRGGPQGSAAPAMLFLHGASGAPAWLPFMDMLSERFDVIVPEHPGFGGTDTPDWLDNIGDVAFFYLDAIERLGLERVHVVGTSLGGWIAAEMAVRSCARIASLTLVCAAGIRVEGLRKADIFMWSPEQTARNLVHDPQLAETLVANLPKGEEAVMTVLKNRLTTARLAWNPRLHNPHLKKWLHRISAPTLVLWGAEDKIVPAGYGPAWCELIPDARLETFAACGHLPHVEMPDRFTRTVTRFIEEVAP